MLINETYDRSVVKNFEMIIFILIIIHEVLILIITTISIQFKMMFIFEEFKENLMTN